MKNTDKTDKSVTEQGKAPKKFQPIMAKSESHSSERVKESNAQPEKTGEQPPAMPTLPQNQQFHPDSIKKMVVAPTLPQQPEGPVSEWTDEQVEQRYHEIKHIRVETMPSDDLDVMSRYGIIASKRRESAETEGFKAEVTKVRRQVEIHANRYATAQFILDRAKKSIGDVKRGGAPVNEGVITIQYGDIAVSVKFSDVAEASASPNNALTGQYETLFKNVCELIKSTSQMGRSRAERSNKKDWTSYTNDIRWISHLNELNTLEEQPS